MAEMSQLFDDDLLDVIFSNIRPKRYFNARLAAEAQTSDDARDRWLKRHTVQRKDDG